MHSSVAPTPVMPKTATAIPRPAAGSWNCRPSATALQAKKRGMRMRTSAASAVSSVKSATFTIAIRSTRS